MVHDVVVAAMVNVGAYLPMHWNNGVSMTVFYVLRIRVATDFWASGHVDQGDKLRSGCLPYDYVEMPDGRKT